MNISKNLVSSGVRVATSNSLSLMANYIANSRPTFLGVLRSKNDYKLLRNKCRVGIEGVSFYRCLYFIRGKKKQRIKRLTTNKLLLENKMINKTDQQIFRKDIFDAYY